jgi:S-ribosylhomocysteine lyase
MLATFLRGGSIGKQVIYFGPMGCRTGFYLLTRDLEPATVLEALCAALEATIAHEGEVFGASRQECGNYLELDLAAAKKECAAYLDVLKKHDRKGDFDYAD